MGLVLSVHLLPACLPYASSPALIEGTPLALGSMTLHTHVHEAKAWFSASEQCDRSGRKCNPAPAAQASAPMKRLSASSAQ